MFLVLILVGLLSLVCHNQAFQLRGLAPVIKYASRRIQEENRIRLQAASISLPEYNSNSNSGSSVNSRDDIIIRDSYSQPVDPGMHIKIKGMELNLCGIVYAAVTLIVAAIVVPFMAVLAFIEDKRGKGMRRRPLDWIIHLWAKVAMTLVFCRVKLIGRENLPKISETVIYVPNHTSLMDILVFSGFVPRPFKYLSKAEIMGIPVIGQAMKLAKHVFLQRDNIQSSFEVTETTIQRLIDGNSMVLFAEGTRSPDGKLNAFKKGAFQMAKQAGVKIVPVSIGNLWRWMPKNALLPLAPIRDVYIKIHPAIDTADLPVSKIRAKCFDAVNSGLPSYQQFATKPAAEATSNANAAE